MLPQHMLALVSLLCISSFLSRLARMNKDARELRAGFPHEDLDLLDEHVSELRFMLDEHVRKGLDV
jgi:hypothetical protein